MPVTCSTTISAGNYNEYCITCALANYPSGTCTKVSTGRYHIRLEKGGGTSWSIVGETFDSADLNNFKNNSKFFGTTGTAPLICTGNVSTNPPGFEPTGNFREGIFWFTDTKDNLIASSNQISNYTESKDINNLTKFRWWLIRVYDSSATLCNNHVSLNSWIYPPSVGPCQINRSTTIYQFIHSYPSISGISDAFCCSSFNSPSTLTGKPAGTIENEFILSQYSQANTFTTNKVITFDSFSSVTIDTGVFQSIINGIRARQGSLETGWNIASGTFTNITGVDYTTPAGQVGAITLFQKCIKEFCLSTDNIFSLYSIRDACGSSPLALKTYFTGFFKDDDGYWYNTTLSRVLQNGNSSFSSVPDVSNISNIGIFNYTIAICLNEIIYALNKLNLTHSSMCIYYDTLDCYAGCITSIDGGGVGDGGGGPGCLVGEGSTADTGSGCGGGVTGALSGTSGGSIVRNATTAPSGDPEGIGGGGADPGTGGDVGA